MTIVLVAVDAGSAALGAARAVRRLLPGAEPVLVSVVPSFEDPELDAGGIEGPSENPETAERDYRAHRVEAAGVLAAAAREFGADPVRQLIVGHPHHGAITGTLTGSAAEHLVHHGRRPVVVVPEPPATA